MKILLEEIHNDIEEMDCLEDAWDIQNKIDGLYYTKKITEKQWNQLHGDILSETQFKDFDLVSIDDCEWELMKEFNPNLSEQ